MRPQTHSPILWESDPQKMATADIREDVLTPKPSSYLVAVFCFFLKEGGGEL